MHALIIRLLDALTGTRPLRGSHPSQFLDHNRRYAP